MEEPLLGAVPVMVEALLEVVLDVSVECDAPVPEAVTFQLIVALPLGDEPVPVEIVAFEVPDEEVVLDGEAEEVSLTRVADGLPDQDPVPVAGLVILELALGVLLADVPVPLTWLVLFVLAVGKSLTPVPADKVVVVVEAVEPGFVLLGDVLLL
jgi:hypothetical protein